MTSVDAMLVLDDIEEFSRDSVKGGGAGAPGGVGGGDSTELTPLVTTGASRGKPQRKGANAGAGVEKRSQVSVHILN